MVLHCNAGEMHMYVCMCVYVYKYGPWHVHACDGGVDACIHILEFSPNDCMAAIYIAVKHIMVLCFFHVGTC